MESIKNDEDLQSIIVQQSSADLVALEKCEDMLTKFLLNVEIKSNIEIQQIDKKFTAVIADNICDDDTEEMIQKKILAKQNVNLDEPITNNTSISYEEAKVMKENVEYLSKIIVKARQSFIGKGQQNFINKIKANLPENNIEDLAAVRERLRIIEQKLIAAEVIVKKHKKYFNDMYHKKIIKGQSYADIDNKVNKIKSNEEEKLTEKEQVEDIHNKVYCVNLNILDKRERMSKLELIERRNEYWKKSLYNNSANKKLKRNEFNWTPNQ